MMVIIVNVHNLRLWQPMMVIIVNVHNLRLWQLALDGWMDGRVKAPPPCLTDHQWLHLHRCLPEDTRAGANVVNNAYRQQRLLRNNRGAVDFC